MGSIGTHIKFEIPKNMVNYIPKEYRDLVTDIYENEKEWNDVTNRWNTPVTVEWQNGESSIFQNKAHMKAMLKEFHSPDEYRR